MSDVPPPLVSPAIPPAPAKKRGCLVPALITLAVLILLGVGIWFWINRPIRPVQLSQEEKAAVETKLEAIQQPNPRSYEKGANEIVLTERELNGLLNENTDLGSRLKFELVDGAVQARYESDLDPDVPIVGGKRLKARARFLVGNEGSQPQLVLEDLTVWGISIPNDWLGGLKGHNLLQETLGNSSGQLPGVKDMKVEDGVIRIQLKE